MEEPVFRDTSAEGEGGRDQEGDREGRGTSRAARRIILRRRAAITIYSLLPLPRHTFNSFSRARYSSRRGGRSRGTPRVETRSWNAYSSRRILSAVSAAFRRVRRAPGRGKRRSSNQCRFKFPVCRPSPSPAGQLPSYPPRALGPAFPGPGAAPGSLIKTSIPVPGLWIQAGGGPRKTAARARSFPLPPPPPLRIIRTRFQMV